MAENTPVGSGASPLAGVHLASEALSARLEAMPPLARFSLRAAPAASAALATAAGLRLPPAINRFERAAGGAVAMQLGPDEWLLQAPPETAQAIERCSRTASEAGLLHALVDIGHRLGGIIASGPRVEAVLATGCPLPLDLARFPVGRATRTLYHKVEIVLARTAADRFEIQAGRSFLPYLAHHVSEAIVTEAAMAATAAAER